MPEKQILNKGPAVIQWVSSKSGASPRRDYIPNRIRMGNGVELPFIGLGTSSVENSNEATEYSIRTALDLGYTHIDVTPGTHKIVGDVLKEYMDSGKLTRQDFFITTKLPCISHSRANVATALNSQLKYLQLDYVDLFLVQSPCGITIRQTAQGRNKFEPTNYSLPETWKGMEDVEVHLHWPQKDLVVLCQSLNVSLTAYAPLGSPGLQQTIDQRGDTSPLDEPLVIYLAQKYKKSPAQILLKQLTQRNIVVIPRSVNAQHLRENLDSLNFTISDNDMEALANVRSRGRIYTYTSRRNHPEYPFNENDDE
ncbi:hypothetical protein GCK72_023729 [Caenorhabditis remanei]|uniref:NADP-dependent oxidoreductase domain-containing protein n=1 Tax=Caenorhabditis remanei TaxID=31234 RepID=A0A6A5FXL5_CAERE|nr:hypothetical protein GCK72_023729 [Caenorhabditis remanei]KAF1747267.1 hypothetical protein GCK72_023729 [Caenorhabditis remanei]